ncbi:AAHS family 4-hydroxybenzoate transporter-like MFS transporter [Ralstonia sp. GP73]|jgi:AAHS family 4-hydroxybenzoate transporter-like MFS transporter|uniref:4-hydroxybenzoate transporter PcaK n=2 Tax=Pseudomonadota TaxID=1224 RepID=A0AAD2BML5_9RALS|nr:MULTISPECIES: MFS transporter [Ralstonia]MBT2179150.1 MFS transporter [Ralstonia pickettii]MDH6641258.1 AAHS family 4-hydroxybenzoate transporter-like MFS transporter [Ralstonia sp. GP73]OCS50189.1 4-hydroxybenzoate transporter [Ralstonia pickettii]CAJ0705899.1 4-hydroxybenzoate transporter PcaK [Ralstonia sp. LMG 18095]CAJ0775523.1 4-hydroxybenzoate transporter PcaK [Ralstonia sp. LMG 18095]
MRPAPAAHEAPSTPIDLARLIDQGKVGGFQILLLAICGLCLIIDGFDVQAMGYVAPAIIKDWNITKASLGPVFGAGLFGMLVGSLVFGVLGDRFGRRPVLIVATFFFAACMLATTQVETVSALLILRFVTGLGLGCIMPNAMALAGEFSPARTRVTWMMLVSCGFTVGAALGGFVSAALLSRFGWHAVFLVGGLVPLVIGVMMVLWLPESLQYLVLKGHGQMRQTRHQRLARWLGKLAPQLQVNAQTQFVVPEAPAGGMPVSALFTEGRAKVTLVLWVINFMNLIDLYFLSNWLPTLIRDAGYPTDTAVLVATALQVGGVIGTLTLGRLIDRLGFVRVLAVCFLIACVTVGLIGHVAAALPVLVAVVFVAGFCIVGGQPAVNALAATYYPTTLRATGIGWSLGVGRIGSVIGPVIGGQLIALQWSGPALFSAAAVPAMVSFGMVLVLTLAASGADAARFASGRTTGKPA